MHASPKGIAGSCSGSADVVENGVVLHGVCTADPVSAWLCHSNVSQGCWWERKEDPKVRGRGEQMRLEP